MQSLQSLLLLLLVLCAATFIHAQWLPLQGFREPRQRNAEVLSRTGNERSDPSTIPTVAEIDWQPKKHGGFKEVHPDEYAFTEAQGELGAGGVDDGLRESEMFEDSEGRDVGGEAESANDEDKEEEAGIAKV
ncbi:hypothetical protein HDV05_001794 [Chytridiales sp. JEL 0842]|nr:hypothetical protein HDV05_001794 [Chytridiales sp. JEL 0842]